MFQFEFNQDLFSKLSPLFVFSISVVKLINQSFDLCDRMIFTLDARFLGFEHIKELYKDDSDFANIYNPCETSALGKFYRLDGYLFKYSHLCVPFKFYRDGCVT